jgi:catechol 2,3-dioxygenase-like lactoylglutathione lyase family enzyme
VAFPLDHIVVYAADPAATGRFYEVLLGALGFRKRRDHVFEREGLFFDVRAATEPGDAYRRGRRGVDHLGFRAETVEEIHAVRQALEQAGQDTGRVIEFDNGDVALFVPDPDGLRFELTRYADPSADPVD